MTGSHVLLGGQVILGAFIFAAGLYGFSDAGHKILARRSGAHGLYAILSILAICLGSFLAAVGLPFLYP